MVIYYNSKIIPLELSEDETISDIISNSNQDSIFKILPKKTKTINLRYQTIESKNNSHSRNNEQLNQFNSLSLSSKIVRNNIKLLSLKENKIFKIKNETIGAIITKFH